MDIGNKDRSSPKTQSKFVDGLNMSSTSFGELRESVRLAIHYVHSCQTEDGGYFFARVPPSSLQDTFFAARILKMLGQQPHRIKAIEHFVLSFQNDYEAQNIHALYLASGTLVALGKSIEILRSASKAGFERFKVQRFDRFDNINVEVVSELKMIFEAVSLFLRFDLPVNKDAVARCILSLANKDGGFGYRRYSTLATTYLAVQSLALMGQSIKGSSTIIGFLEKREKSVYFIEDLFYIMMIRSILNERPLSMGKNQAISFILGYQRANGGFARARIIGIPTLEYTHYAIALLKLLGGIPGTSPDKQSAVK
jgi:hypothetical protein